MTEEYWANSQFSVARYYGGLTIGGRSYKIVISKVQQSLS